MLHKKHIVFVVPLDVSFQTATRDLYNLLVHLKVRLASTGGQRATTANGHTQTRAQTLAHKYEGTRTHKTICTVHKQHKHTNARSHAHRHTCTHAHTRTDAQTPRHTNTNTHARIVMIAKMQLLEWPGMRVSSHCLMYECMDASMIE